MTKMSNNAIITVIVPAYNVYFFEKNGFSHIQTIIRNIPNKRLPSKTNPSNVVGGVQVNTMTKEYIVILKKNLEAKLF